MLKNRLFIVLAILLAAVSCSTTRKTSQQTYTPSWRGCSAQDIIAAMGNPDRIDEDGRGGSILVYESSADYDDPQYDILDPEATPKKGRQARFYLDQEGDCYQVESNYNLPAPPRSTVVDSGGWGWFEVLITLLLVVEVFL